MVKFMVGRNWNTCVRGRRDLGQDDRTELVPVIGRNFGIVHLVRDEMKQE